MKVENLLYSQAVIQRKYGYYERPVFNHPRSGKGKESDVDWQTFKGKFHPFITIDTSPVTGTPSEMLFTTKDVSWSTKDVNIWIGGESREIDEVADMTDAEGRVFFSTGLELCRDLTQESLVDHSFSIGFNPGDIGMPGHHNVRRLHAHLRGYNYQADTSTIQEKRWKDMSWYDRLTFMEPFSQIFYDYIQHHLKNRPNGVLNPEQARLSNGVVAMPITNGYEDGLFDEVKSLYSAMRDEHAVIEEIFTDRTIDGTTGRYVPRDRNDIHQRLSGFLEQTDIYSERSRELLQYLACNIVPASKRPEAREAFVTDPSHIYITKGFAGAMNIAYDGQESQFRFEFLPRVITTSAVAKTMFGKDAPTIMGKHVPATEQQRVDVEEYKRSILNNVLRMDFYPGTVSSELLAVA